MRMRCLLWVLLTACRPISGGNSSNGSPSSPCAVVDGATLAAPVVFLWRDDPVNAPGVPARFRVVDIRGQPGTVVDVPGALQDPVAFWPGRNQLLLRMRDSLESWDTALGGRHDSVAVSSDQVVLAPDGRRVVLLAETLMRVVDIDDGGGFSIRSSAPLARPLMNAGQWTTTRDLVLNEWDPVRSITSRVLLFDVDTGSQQTLWEAQDDHWRVDHVFLHVESGTLLLQGAASQGESRAVRVSDGVTLHTEPTDFRRLDDGSLSAVTLMDASGIVFWTPWQTPDKTTIPGSAGMMPVGVMASSALLTPYPAPAGLPQMMTVKLDGTTPGSWALPMDDVQPELLMHDNFVSGAVTYIAPSGVLRVGVAIGFSDVGLVLGDMVLGKEDCVFQSHVPQLVYTRNETFLAIASASDRTHVSLMTILPDGTLGRVNTIAAADVGMLVTPEKE